MVSSKTYGFASDAFLHRARRQLDSETCEGLFYAAYELRCGIEARMREYLDGHDHISKEQKKEWKLGKLSKTVEKFFGDTNRVTEVTISPKQNPSEKYVAYYTPVTPELIKLGQQLGDLLHAQKKYIPPEDSFWKTTRNTLEWAYDLLETSTKGILMGPPIWLKSKKRAGMIISSACEEETKLYQKLLKKGDEITVEIKHLDGFPD